MNFDFEKLKDKLGLNSFQFQQWYGVTMRIVMALGGAYILAVSGNALVMWVLSSQTIGSYKAQSDVVARRSTVAVKKDINYRNAERTILDRNVFNSDGEVPDETVADEAEGAKPSTFNLDAPCNKPTLPVELVGTIYLGSRPNSGSLATIKEKGYIQADVYKVGDEIIGNEQAIVAKIEPRMVVINNAGSKECLEKDVSFKGFEGGAPPANDAGEFEEERPPAEGEQPAKEPAPGPAGDVTLEVSYVEQQVGEGGGNILNQGRLVPFNQDGQMKGFKLISLKSGGLFDKIGLKNGDVITQVNDVSLKQPDQGFAFYQVFENESEININFLRGGKTPQTISVKVK